MSKNGQHFDMYTKNDHTPATYTLMNFKVGEIEQVIDELTAKGVLFEQYDMPEIKTDEKGIVTHGTRKMAWFKDPAGNILGLTQE